MKVKKIIKYTTLVVFGLLFLCMMGILIAYLVYAGNSTFDSELLQAKTAQVQIFDDKNNVIHSQVASTRPYVKLGKLNSHTINAFVSSEDKSFFSHKGLNYKRMIKATLVNLKSRKLRQGGSTISQQLIKNTHLTNERTLERKFKEIALTKQLERRLTKNEILENYLNIIYFGNDCYGIEEASNYYFSKQAKDLTLSESAMLAGIITAPNHYSPTTSLQRATKKRNIVLGEMMKDGHISPNDYKNEISKELQISIQKDANNKVNSYVEYASNEASEILKMPQKAIIMSGYRIFTYHDKESQEILQNCLEKNSSNIGDLDCCAINIDPKSGGISAIASKSDFKILSAKRQPGSCIKPVLVYAPALERNIISPASMILDEEININGYSPQNVNKKYQGNVSVRNCVSKSLNVPAVKTLSYVGIETAKEYAKKCGIEFEKEDNNYALALGGFTKGTNIKQLTNSYLPFVNSGKMRQAKFVKYICDAEGQIVYRNKAEETQVFRDDTAFLMTDMLKSSTNFGTAKKLYGLGFDIASKTGTVGNHKGNTDCYNISFTSENLLGVWIGDLRGNNRFTLTGGNLPTSIAKEIYQQKYYKRKPANFEMPASVEKVDIDLLDLKENATITKANNFTPERYRVKEVFSKFNLPQKVSESFVNLDSVKLETKTNGEKTNIVFDAKEFLEYELYESVDGNVKLVKEFKNVSGEQEYSIDKNDRRKKEYYVVAKIKNFADNLEVVSKKSNIVSFCFAKSEGQKNLERIKSKWYI